MDGEGGGGGGGEGDGTEGGVETTDSQQERSSLPHVYDVQPAGSNNHHAGEAPAADGTRGGRWSGTRTQSAFVTHAPLRVEVGGAPPARRTASAGRYELARGQLTPGHRRVTATNRAHRCGGPTMGGYEAPSASKPHAVIGLGGRGRVIGTHPSPADCGTRSSALHRPTTIGTNTQGLRREQGRRVGRQGQLVDR